SQQEDEGPSQVYLYSLDQAKNFPVTEGRYAATSPAFSGDGKYLFFVSQRDFNPIYSATEWNHAYRDMARIYFVTLSKDTPSPFRPRSEDSDEAPKAKAKAKDEKPVPKAKETVLKIDIAGIDERVLRLPVTPANYRNL